MTSKKMKKKANVSSRSLSITIIAGASAVGLMLVVVGVCALINFRGRKSANDGLDGPLVRDPKPPEGQVALADIPAGEAWSVEPDAAEAPASGARSAFVLAN